MLKLDIQLFAVPFRKVSKTRKRMRWSLSALTIPGLVASPSCGEMIKAHRVCPKCGSIKVTFGVFDRIELIKDKKETKSPKTRPPYIYQIPLGFIPGVGPKQIEKLLDHFGTEMTVLHKLSKDDIESVVGEKIANKIVEAREWKVKIESGGGGVYGKVKKE